MKHMNILHQIMEGCAGRASARDPESGRDLESGAPAHHHFFGLRQKIGSWLRERSFSKV